MKRKYVIYYPFCKDSSVKTNEIIFGGGEANAGILSLSLVSIGFGCLSVPPDPSVHRFCTSCTGATAALSTTSAVRQEFFGPRYGR